MADGSTIYALSSGAGKAGIAVVRVSGPKVREVIAAMCPNTRAGRELQDRRAAFRKVVHPATGELLDRGVVILFEARGSETGEDVVEFQIHGGRATVRALLDALGTMPGCRMAEPGEFARRAFLNGRMNLAEVEQLGDLVEAETEAQRRMALTTAPAMYESWRQTLIAISGLTEAAIDFSDEADVAERSLEMARDRATALRDDIRRHLDDGHRGEILREGFRVTLLGPPNAGKSSLLNALARREAAIVSDEAGTTRDVIEVRLDLGGYPVIVSDTAGIRETDAHVEQEGIRRSLAAARDAQLTLWLSESGIDFRPAEISRETSLVIRSKSDLAHKGVSSREAAGAALAISTKTGDGLDGLVALIAAKASAAMGAPDVAPAVARARHRQHLEEAEAGLAGFLSGGVEAPELRAEDVRRAAHALGRITGRVDVEDVLGEIFSRFCIGK